VRLYLIYFQSSAGRPQAGDRILCRLETHFRAEGRRDAGFGGAGRGRNGGGTDRGDSAAVKIRGKPRRARDFENPGLRHPAAVRREIESASVNISGWGLIP
jgi:hypothetical protein